MTTFIRIKDAVKMFGIQHQTFLQRLSKKPESLPHSKRCKCGKMWLLSVDDIKKLKEKKDGIK